ncbi:hypothetical protein [Aliivibrio wodanis]|uniref:hypothetical protein n=1 Tax=Aliivibrio wodanis TaxID=80852 RepID=UPI00406C584F
MKKTITILFLLFLSGCADHINEKQGSHINVVPITYSISINSQDSAVVQSAISQFIEKHGIKNKKGYWVISIAKNDVLRLESIYQQYLQELGYDLNQMKTEAVSDKEHFKVSLSFSTQRIEYEICDYEQIDYYGSTSLGCYTESNRWHSMVNPKNAM